LDLNYLFPDDQIDLLDNNDRTTQLDARAEDDDSIDENFINEILAEDRILNDDPNEAPGPMEVVGDYLVPQPEPETFSNIPVCVPTNNQNNTDGDPYVVQDPADRLAAQKDIFSEGPIVETVAHYQSHGSTSNEDPDNLKDLEAKISLIKETSPQSITSDLTPDHAHLPQSQTSSAPTPPSNCVSVIRSNIQAQPGKIQRASVSHREAPYTVPPNVDTENLTDLEAEIAVILTSSAPTPNPEAEKKENSLQKHRRIKKEREEVEKERTKFLIADNTRLVATIAVLEQELGVPQSQTSSAPPTRCVTVSESNTQAQPGKIQHASVSHREAPHTVPPKFQCDQCDFSSPSPHGLKIHTGKAHNLHTEDLSSTARNPADAKRSREYRGREKIKEQNAVEELKSLKEQNIKLKAQLRIMVEQRLFK